jgi:hypothetical protein
MREMEKETLQKILEDHAKWLCGKDGEKAYLSNADLNSADLSKADLRGADLSKANLSYADLRYANLSNANLSNADLSNADLDSADLRYANLSNADLSKADLDSANLRGANLRGADLSKANLSYADLRYANLSNADLSNADLNSADLSNANLRGTNLNDVLSNSDTFMYHLQCPEEGSYIAWKKCRNEVLVKLLIPEDALRSSATSRKCRASKAIVLEIIGAEYAVSKHDSAFTYKVGETLEVEDFDINRWEECSTGIHHFITRAEAESY